MQSLVLHSLLPFLLITCFISINLQLCLCADDPQYVNCSQAINCRDIKNVSYPFWGVNRQSNIPMITTKNIKFRILEMNSSTHTVTVADRLSGTPASWTVITQDCPAYKRNISVSYATGSTVIDLMNCESVVHVPVFDTAAKDLENNEKDINDVLELGLKTDNDQCSRCEGSGGKCGCNSTDSRFICFCQNKAHATTCSKNFESGMHVKLSQIF
ncbi:hypothetical protein PRUPE_3G145500 [Prunus persica]|uniref:Wall-associated receptor kinase C-terminal domain-containing protein n=1 Tax=Prunus persica TaxID=3760 RepID=A0A251Q1D9_PRUPE|nr:hypothetical protein PRUPE_3G145500 [Prunus persica]